MGAGRQQTPLLTGRVIVTQTLQRIPEPRLFCALLSDNLLEFNSDSKGPVCILSRYLNRTEPGRAEVGIEGLFCDRRKLEEVADQENAAVPERPVTVTWPNLTQYMMACRYFTPSRHLSPSFSWSRRAPGTPRLCIRCTPASCWAIEPSQHQASRTHVCPL